MTGSDGGGQCGLTRRELLAATALLMMNGGCAEAVVLPDQTSVAIPENFFGLHVNNGSPNGLWKQVQTPFPHINERAIRLWDSGTNWRNVNPGPGTFDFSNLDFRIRQARANGCQVMMTLGQAPDWATSERGTNITNNPHPPTRIEDWNNYVEALVRHCGTAISYYEPWNEPDVPGSFSGTLDQLLELARNAHAIVKRIAPTARVMSPAFSMPYGIYLNSPIRLENWGAAGGFRYCDAVSVHAYPGDGFPPETVLARMHEVHAILSRTGAASLPVYDSESGARGWRDENGALHNSELTHFSQPLPTTPIDMQSAYLTRHLICVALSGVRQSYYFTFDNPSGHHGTTSVMAIHMTDYPEHPASLRAPALAYRYIAGLLAGGELRDFAVEGDRRSVRFTTRDRRDGSIHWTRDHSSAVLSVPPGSSVFDNLGQPVTARENMRIGPSPLFIFRTRG